MAATRLRGGVRGGGLLPSRTRPSAATRPPALGRTARAAASRRPPHPASRPSTIITAASAGGGGTGGEAEWADAAPGIASLPIAPHLPSITARLASAPTLVLEAAPGAGKTTALPLAIALGLGLRVLVVEPRRLAARAAARRMAGLLGERVGGRVGFKVRGASRVSEQTVVEVVTPGLALRALAGATAAAVAAASGASSPPLPCPPRPILPRFGAVLLDEVHERGVESDAALALLAAGSPLRTARPDLRVVAASATLGGGLGARVGALLAGGGSGEEAVLSVAEGRAWPVTTLYAGPPRGPHDSDLAGAVLVGLKAGWAAAAGPPGDALVFLPGAREIRATQAALASAPGLGGAVVLPLYGALPAADQDAVLRPPPPPPPPTTLGGGGEGGAGGGRARRIILATPVAESSLTVPGVTLVVDSGLARSPAPDAAGLDRLVTGPIPASAADQRRGRAGRTGPGVCVRLWSEASHARRPASGVPAILRSDLAPTALVLARTGLDAASLAWLDRPPEVAVAAAARTLRALGAVEEETNDLTAAGGAMAALGAHPRLARMLLVAAGMGAAQLGAVAAGLVGAGRDVFPPRGRHGLGADLGVRVLALAGIGPGAASLDARAARAVLSDAAVLYGQLRRVAGRASAAGAAAAEEDEEGGGGGADTSDDEEEEEEEGEETADGGSPSTNNESEEAAGGSPPSMNNPLPRYGRGPSAWAALAVAAAAQAGGVHPSPALGALLAAAYPDRIAVRRARSNRGRDAAFDLGGWREGDGATTTAARLPDPADPLQAAPLLVTPCLASSSPGRAPVILAASPLDPTHPACLAVPGLVVEEAGAEWVGGGGSLRLVARARTRVGGAVVGEVDTDPAALPPAALESAAVRLAASAGLGALGAPPSFSAARARAAWWASGRAAAGDTGRGEAWPDLSESALAATLPAWLPGLEAARTGADLAALPWEGGLRVLLSEAQWGAVDAGAPAAWEARPGVAVELRYDDASDGASSPPLALVPLDLAFEAGLAAGTPPPPAAGVALVLPGGSGGGGGGGGGASAAPPLATGPSLEDVWKDWPRLRAALRRRPGGGMGRKEWPEWPPGGGGGATVGAGAPAAGAAAKRGKKKKKK